MHEAIVLIVVICYCFRFCPCSSYLSIFEGNLALLAIVLCGKYYR